MEVFKTLEKIIETPFVEDEFEVGSVCFANDEDLRADFKLQFTTYDVVNYVYGMYQLHFEENEKLEISLLKIPYPVSASSFWHYCNIEKKFRQEHPIQEMEFIVVSELNWESV